MKVVVSVVVVVVVSNSTGRVLSEVGEVGGGGGMYFDFSFPLLTSTFLGFGGM